jgi:ABC-type transport system involved in multi-copper enzyme maturation permease subunit
MKKTYTIAITTARETIRQPLFVILLIGVFLFLLIIPFIPYFTFGEDIKMVKDTGLAALLLSSLFLALWTASNTVAEDIEHRTAITLLSKPINRRQFIVGKFFGILLGVGLLFLLLSVVFCLLLIYKAGYDAREAGREIPAMGERVQEVWQTLPGIVLTFFQVIVLSALSVAISTRLPLVVNFVVCITIYFLGHLAHMLVKASEGSFELVEFTARMVEVVLPALNFFDVAPAVATGSMIPFSYVTYNLLYCILYTTAAILLAFILFEDRDLA